MDEAKQFYPLFGLGANVALIFSGRAVKIFSQVRAGGPPAAVHSSSVHSRQTCAASGGKDSIAKTAVPCILAACTTQEASALSRECINSAPPRPSRAPSQIRANLPPGVDGWGVSLRGLMGMVVVGGLIISAVFWWLNRVVSGGRRRGGAGSGRAVPGTPCRPCMQRHQNALVRCNSLLLGCCWAGQGGHRPRPPGPEASSTR